MVLTNYRLTESQKNLLAVIHLYVFLKPRQSVHDMHCNSATVAKKFKYINRITVTKKMIQTCFHYFSNSTDDKFNGSEKNTSKEY